MNEFKSTPRPDVPTGNFQIGGRECNLACPWCVSQMTGKDDQALRFEKRWRKNIGLALDVFEKFGVRTVLITSKGEPLLHFVECASVIQAARNRGFITELQTNGVLLAENNGWIAVLEEAGLNVVAISRYSVSTNDLCLIDGRYYPDYDLTALIKKINDQGMKVRLTFMSMRDHNDTLGKIENTCSWAHRFGVPQITVRRMGMPNLAVAVDKAKAIMAFVIDNRLSDTQWTRIVSEIMAKDHPLVRRFDWGSVSWYINGVEMLLADCLTNPGLEGTVRYLIYGPDGHMRISWEYENAILF